MFRGGILILLILSVSLQIFECSAFLSWFYSSNNGPPSKHTRGASTSTVVDYGECSHYGDASEDSMFSTSNFRTQSGELFNPNDLTGSHRTLPLNSYVTVTNEITKRTVVVRINDRGPSVDGRVMELSPSAFNQIADLDEAVVPCIIEIK